MWSIQAIQSSTASGGGYERIGNKAQIINFIVAQYSFIPVLLVVLAMTIFLVKNKRKERFEWTIIVLMACRYAINASANYFSNIQFWNDGSKIILFSLYFGLGPLYH